MNRTGIAWTNETWNVFSGCAKVSPGCNFCFAKTIAERHRGDKAFPDGFELTIREHRLEDPLKIKEPRLIFVNSMSDFFLEEVPDELRDRMVDMMERTPQHQYQILTKRPSEMLRYAKRRRFPSNCWLGVSVESQNFVNRIDLLREVDVGIRFLSCEPLLGPLNLNLAQINWVIVGGESGSHLSKPEIRAKRSLVDYDAKTKQWTPRPDRYHLVTSIRDQCIDAKVPFFFKQWGGFKPDSGGNLLDGRVWEEYPRLPEQEQLTNDGGIMTALNHPKILDGINITPMTAQEARECVTAIIGNLESLGAMLLDLDRRRGWEALGYCSFRECAMAEFGKSQGYVYKLLHAAEVDENLAASEIYPLDKSEIAKIATSHKEELHKLPPNQQALALKRADELAYAEGKPREVRHVAAVVKEYKSVEKETEAKGESLGLPARGDSTLSETDRIDKLTHTSPMDVDDRPCAAPGGANANSVESSLSEVLDDEHSPAPQQQDGESTKEQKKSFNRLTPLMNSSSPEHYTPRHVLDAVIGCIGEIELDPCSNSKEEPNVPAKRHFTLEDDGLSLDWKAETLFMNPPYGREIEPWIEKLVSSHRSGSVVSALALVPARTDTQWFKRLRDYPVCFVEGRITFVGNEDPAPFPSAIFYLGDRRDKFFQAFQQLGDIWERIEPDAVGESVDELTRLRTELETAQATIVELQSKLQAAQATIAELQFKLQGTPSQTRAEVPDYTELETINNAIATTAPAETEAPGVIGIEPLTGIKLAKRLGVHQSNVTRNRDEGKTHFRFWSGSEDPEGVQWEFRPGPPRTPQYYPVACRLPWGRTKEYQQRLAN